MKKLRIDIWSDIACPWCYVGKRRLEAALAQFPDRDSVEIVWRAFELDPSAPRVRDKSISVAQRLAQKYGTSTAQAQSMIDRMTNVARGDGLDFHFERLQAGNTFDAHRVLHLAATRGKQDIMKERFLRGYLTEGEAIGEPETIIRLAAEVGLDEQDVRATLASDAYAHEVRADEKEARENGVTGVPFFVFDGRIAVSGAQPMELFVRVLEQVWNELQAKPVVFEEGAACGPDGCG
ncbi:MAG TPA: DsbA family oxidoreductase [Polyangium sp.]|nr:DsbA family oxidoreductase [Polyangium sp.]